MVVLEWSAASYERGTTPVGGVFEIKIRNCSKSGIGSNFDVDIAHGVSGAGGCKRIVRGVVKFVPGRGATMECRGTSPIRKGPPH